MAAAADDDNSNAADDDPADDDVQFGGINNVMGVMINKLRPQGWL